MEPSDTFLKGDKVISTTLERENDKFIKSSVDDLVPILRESEVTPVYDDLECSMPLDSLPSPGLDVLGKRKVDIDLPFGEHLDTLSTGDREIDFNPRDIETNDLIPVPRVFDEPLGNSDSVPRSYDVTFSNPLFDFNDDYTLCYDNPLFDEEFEDISSLDPPESTPVIDESSLLVTPPPASKQLSLREVERFDPFFSLTQSGEETRVMEIPSFGFHHMPSPRPAAYSPKEVMYRFYHPHLTSGDGFDPESKKLDRRGGLFMGNLGGLEVVVVVRSEKKFIQFDIFTQGEELFLGKDATRTITNMLFNLIQVDGMRMPSTGEGGSGGKCGVVTLRLMLGEMEACPTLVSQESLSGSIGVGEDIGEDNFNVMNVLRMRVYLYWEDDVIMDGWTLLDYKSKECW
ncbi:hypothetical protein Tco_0201973 [Tanacetum coccineum]